MDENADLERRAIEALRRYREAPAKVEELEQGEASARQALVEWQGRVEIAIFDGRASPGGSHLIQIGQTAIARLQEVRFAMSEATAALDLAYKALTALDDELGYIPVPGAANPDATGAAGASGQDSRAVTKTRRFSRSLIQARKSGR